MKSDAFERTFTAGSATGPAMALETAIEAMVATMYFSCILEVDDFGFVVMLRVYETVALLIALKGLLCCVVVS